MNVHMKPSFALLVKANVYLHFSGRKLISSTAVPVAAGFTCGGSGRRLLRAEGRRENTRGISTNCRNGAESRSPSGDDILKRWTKSILSQPAGRDTLPKEVSTLKRPPVATFQKGIGGDSEKESSTKGAKKLRRRLTDNTWTTSPMDDKIIWVDCEMTGLDPQKDLLIEIGVIITDAELNVIATQDSIVFHAEDSVLDGMEPWCVKHHGESGLTAACKNSKITHAMADEELLRFLENHTTKGECPMAGNSIGQDRGFIRLQLPKFHSHFHYRDIDVSSIKEIVRRWYPEAYAAAPRKKRAHRVLDDIKESIEELQYYRSTVFASPKDAANAAAKAKRVC